MYSARIKKKAWGSILLLIAAGNTSKLIEHVLKWRDADIKIFLADLLKFLPRGWSVLFSSPICRRISSMFLRLFSTLGDPSPVSKHARHLQEPDSCLPMQLVYFMYGLLETSARLKTNANSLQDAQASVLSFASFVSGSGKMALGPNVFLRGLDLYVGHAAVASVVKFYVCARLNRISTLLRTFTGFSLPIKGQIDVHSEILEIYRSARLLPVNCDPLIPIFQTFCTRPQCPATDQGTPLYFHSTFSRRFAGTYSCRMVTRVPAIVHYPRHALDVGVC